MKRKVAIFLAALISASSLSTTVSYGDSDGALEVFLDQLSKVSEDKRETGASVLKVYLEDSDSGIRDLKRDLDSFLNENHIKTIHQKGYSLADVKAELDRLNGWSMDERMLLIDHLSNGDSNGIRDLVSSAGKGTNPAPEGTGSSGGSTSGGSAITTDPKQGNIKENPKKEELIEVNFKDINEHKNKDSIIYLAQRGIIEGKTKDTFDPNGDLTRAEFMTLICRVLGIKPANNEPLAFKDIKVNGWYYEYIKAAFDNKIIEGTSPTTFSPNNKVTREQMVVIIMRILNDKKITFTLDPINKDVLMYKDADKISSWAATDMFYGVKYGIIEGRTETALNPKDFATRGEAAEIIKKLYDLMKNKGK